MGNRVIEWLVVPGFYLVAAAILARGRGRLLRAAALLGLFGALPGYVLVIADIGLSVSHPAGVAARLAFAAKTAWLAAPFIVIGTPVAFGPYCFAAALAGGFLVQVAQESPNEWLPIAAIVVLPLAAAVPMALLFGPVAFGAAAFWAAALLISRRALFDERPPGAARAAYRWLTRFERG